MLRRINHLDFLQNVTELCQRQARLILKTVGEVSPVAAIWFRKHSLNEMLWFYSDFVLLFKRSFGDQIWTAWFQLNCSLHPSNWLSYFSVAIVLSLFSDLCQLEDVMIPTIMDKFPKLMVKLDFKKVGYLAEWLYLNKKIEEFPSLRESVNHEPYDFQLFEKPK